MEIIEAKKVADSYSCKDCGEDSYRVRLEHENPVWGGITHCAYCGSGNTVLEGTGMDVPEDQMKTRSPFHHTVPKTPRVPVVPAAVATVSRDTYSEAISLMASKLP
jgi:hypothetical protein